MILWALSLKTIQLKKQKQKNRKKKNHAHIMKKATP